MISPHLLEARVVATLVDEGKKDIETINRIKTYCFTEPTEKRAEWFFNSYQQSATPHHWISIWQKMLSEWKPAEASSSQEKQWQTFIKIVTEKVIHRKDHALCLAIMDFPEHRNSLLNNLVQSHINNELTLNMLSRLSTEAQLILFEDLIKLSIEKYNATLLQKLRTLTAPFSFDACITKFALGEKEKIKLSKLLALSETKANYINEKMKAFANGYGLIRDDDALLTLAQVRDRKRYEYAPVLLNIGSGSSDFSTFLEALSSVPKKPIRKQFVLAGPHYVAGEVIIEEDGIGKIWFIDSLSVDEASSDYALTHIDHCIREFAKTFPRHEVFISQEKRQHASKGCSAFALDDVAHLPKLHLGERYSETGIWGYLSDASKQPSAACWELPETTPPVRVVSCSTPVSLVRTMQSRAVLDDVIPKRDKEERDLVINKKGETALVSARGFFREIVPGKIQNTRLDYKFKKMEDANWEFLEKHSPEEIEEKKKFFTVETFDQTIKEQLLKKAAEAEPAPDASASP